jgi:hypothetical protein
VGQKWGKDFRVWGKDLGKWGKDLGKWGKDLGKWGKLCFHTRYTYTYISFCVSREGILRIISDSQNIFLFLFFIFENHNRISNLTNC